MECQGTTFVSDFQYQLVFVPVSQPQARVLPPRPRRPHTYCFDDSSSISSGEISDTINEISTDDHLTGSSLGSSLSGNGSDRANPYGSLKRVPNGTAGTSLTTRSLPTRTSNLLHAPKTSNAILGRNLNPERVSGGGERPASGGKESLENILGENWRKYCIGEDISNSSGGSFERGGLERASLPVSAKERNDLKGLGYHQPGLSGAAFIKKKSNQATITDLRSRSLRNNGGTAIAVEDPDLQNSPEGEERTEGKKKRDSETNTDHSVLMMRKGQKGAGVPPTGYGFSRRPLSANSHKASNGKLSEAEAQRGERLSNYNKATPTKTSSGSQTYPRDTRTDIGPQGYSTLERKKGMMSSKTQTGVPLQNGYQSNTLDRKRNSSDMKERLFGSRGNLTKGPDGQLIGSTIISNPHATYSKQEAARRAAGVRSDGEYSPTSPYVNVSIAAGYMSDNYLPSRPLSTISPSGASPWTKGGPMRMAMSETESMESLSNIQAQIQQARALSLTSRNILASINNPQNGIHRSDSFKSTKSEQVYPTSRADTLPRTNSFTHISADGGAGPSSPTPSQGSGRFAYPLTSTGAMGLVRSNSNAGNPPYANVFLPGLSKLSGSRDDDLHGSSLSLVSTSSSVYSTAEEKQQAGIKKLRRELEAAQEKVATLSTQLGTNAHVVAAFEQSLSNMTTRLQQLTSTAEAKDTELNELRATIEALRQQSGMTGHSEATFSPGSMRRQSSTLSTLSREPCTPGELPRMSRHMSSDSVSSLNSLSSACSGASQQSSATDIDSAKKKKKKNWLRSSFSKAFSRKKNKNGSMSDAELDTQSLRSDTSVPNSPLLHIPHHPLSMPTTPIKGSGSSGALSNDMMRDDAVLDLQQQLHEKDMKLTDIRLEALSSAHQLEQLRETMTRMKNEMASLKADNDRLQRVIVTKGSPTGSQPTSPPGGDSLEKRLSLGDPSSLDLLLSETPDRGGRRITISVSQSPSSELSRTDAKMIEILIGVISVSGKTKWEMLDSIVRRVFKEYVIRLDPATNLGINTDSVYGYQVGEITRLKGREKATTPELLPCGYLVGESTNIMLTLKSSDQSSVDSLAFETLIPKSIVQRYVSLLLEHRRIILCGPSGTGKSYLAQKLAEYLVLKAGKELTTGSIATFNVDHKSSKELRQYLANIADQCESTTADELPNVIILDNLHHVGSLGEVFNGFLSVKYQNCPYIIGTMNQATCSTTNLQLHHNFRWVLCANHMEPVKGFLGRFLRRKCIEEEVRSGMRNADLNKIVDWMPKVWQHLNKFLETHSSSDVTIGPRLFLSCPMDVQGAQVWFTDLWNYSIVPYMMEAVKEGMQQSGRRAPWEDPAEWVILTYPWPNPGTPDWPTLLRLRPEDVGYDPSEASSTPSSPAPNRGSQQGAPAEKKDLDADQDPLLNMLMRLQEAASYNSSPQITESDSMDSAEQANRTEHSGSESVI